MRAGSFVGGGRGGCTRAASCSSRGRWRYSTAEEGGGFSAAVLCAGAGGGRDGWDAEGVGSFGTAGGADLGEAARRATGRCEDVYEQGWALPGAGRDYRPDHRPAG